MGPMATAEVAKATRPETPTDDLAILVRGLRKVYGDFEAVRGIDFEVRRGEVFGLLGPNGAGKTTTVEILEGYRVRTAGTVSVLGFDPGARPRALRARLGIVLQSTGLYRHIRVREALEHFASMYPHPRSVDEVIALTGLEGKEQAMARTLSGGQLRRLDLALGLVGDPELIFLDEPTTGFDPSARRNAWEIVRSMRALGKTIVLTTHYMEEAQELADRICVMAHGAVVGQGTPHSLRDATATRTRIRFTVPTSVPPDMLPLAVTMQDGTAVFETATPTVALRDLTVWATGLGLELDGLEVVRPSLEDV